MKSIIIGALAVASTVAFPALSLAATYQYVNMQGSLGEVTADTAAEAIMIPTDIAPNSGVILEATSTPVIPTDTTVAL